MNPQLVNNGVKEMMYGTPYTYKGLASPVDDRGLSAPMGYGANETLQLQLTQYPGPAPITPSGFRYNNLILADNGFLYSFPFGTEKILKVNPLDGTFIEFGSLGAGNTFRGGVRAANGKLYGIPGQSSFVAILDTQTDTITTVGSLGAQVDKYCGGVLAPNGKIYCPPNRAGDILVIDTATDTISSLGTFVVSTTFKFTGAVLAPNGKIYCVPGRDTNGTTALGERKVLIIDPKTDTYYFTDSIYNYGPPNFSLSVSYVGANLAMNNKIYSVGWGVTAVLEIDPENDSVRYIPLKGFSNAYGTGATFRTTNGNYFPLSGTGQLATNGKIYSQLGNLPSLSASLSEISPYEFDVQAETLNKIYGSDYQPLSFTINSTFCGGAGTIDRQGNIWFASWGTPALLKLSGFPPATPEMYTVPPLEMLATSLYNKFINKANGVN